MKTQRTLRAFLAVALHVAVFAAWGHVARTMHQQMVRAPAHNVGPALPVQADAGAEVPEAHAAHAAHAARQAASAPLPRGERLGAASLRERGRSGG